MEKERKYLVYKITNLINEMIYVGIHATYDINDSYLGSGSNIQKALNEFGKKNFKKEFLYIFDNEKDMLDKEAEIVNLDFIRRIDTYNIALGGSGFSMLDAITVKDKEGNYHCVNRNDPRYLSGELVSMFKDMVPVKDFEGNFYSVSINDPKYLSGELVYIHTGKVVVKDKNNNIFQVNVNDPKYLSGELVHVNKDMLMAKNSESEIFYINKNDPRYLSKELVHVTKGTINIKDKNGNNFRVKLDDPRYLSGELKYMFADVVYVKDKDGNIICIDRDDPRFLSGELESIHKNTIVVKDDKGNRFRASLNDPKYLSGEWKHIRDGMTHSDEAKQKMSDAKIGSIPWNKGIPFTEDVKGVMSNSRKDFIKNNKDFQTGEKNPMFGKIWFYNLELKKNKGLKNEEIEEYIKLGWIKGRKFFNKFK